MVQLTMKYICISYILRKNKLNTCVYSNLYCLYKNFSNQHIYTRLNLGDFFVAISFLMQSFPKSSTMWFFLLFYWFLNANQPLKFHILSTVFPSKLWQVCKNLQNLWPTSDSSSFDSKGCFFFPHAENFWECTQHCKCTNFRMI